MKFVALNIMRQKQGVIGEIAAILWDTKTNTVWDQLSIIVSSENDKPDLEDKAIPADLRMTNGQELDGPSFTLLSQMIDKSDLIITFGDMYSDRFLLEDACKKVRQKNNCFSSVKPWSYLKEDIELEALNNKNEYGLAEMARTVNIPLPLPLRAFSRALCIAQIAHKHQKQIGEVLENPRYVVKANIQYEEREKVKIAGFRWQIIFEGGKQYDKAWVKVLRKDKIELFEKKWGFTVIIEDRFI